MEAILVQDDNTDIRATLKIAKSNMFLSRYEWSNIPEDLHSAVSCAQEAVELTLEDHACFPTRLATYAMGRRKLWERLQSQKDLETALQMLERAKVLCFGSDGRQFVLCQLAKARYCKYKATNNMYDKAAAFEAGREAWREANGSPKDMEDLIDEIAVFVSVQNGSQRHPEDIVKEILERGEDALLPF